MLPLIISFYLFYFSLQSTVPYCLNPQGNEVDWYVIFLFPTSAASDNKLHYGYLDSNSYSELEDYTYSEDSFPPTLITKFVTEGKSDRLNYFFWNDDRATKEESSSHGCPKTMAHAKGSLVYNEDSGAFLQHSLPRFPTRTNENEMLTELPGNSGLYGQTFLCISVTKDTANYITELLNYEYVSVNYGVKKDNVNSPPDKWVEKLIENSYDKSWDIDGTYYISSIGGEKFTVHLRSYRVNYIPFDEPIRSFYQSSFYVRTWTRPASAESLCEKYKLLNVKEVKFLDYDYISTKEHSKWAVALKKDIVCFADVNHTEAQKSRGGSIICFENEAISKIMRKAVVDNDTCDEIFRGNLRTVGEGRVVDLGD